MGWDSGGYPSGKAEKLTPPPKSACRPSSTCACSAAKDSTTATASTEFSLPMVSSDPFTHDILTATSFLNQVFRKAGLDPSDVKSVTLQAGFNAVVEVIVRDADGFPVYTVPDGDIETTQLEIPVLWDTTLLKGASDGSGDDRDS